MKTLLILLFSLFIVLLSCQRTNQSTNEGIKTDEELVDTTPKATAIFWIDKEKNIYSKQKKDPLPVRTVKAKVNILNTGRVEVLSYVKPQDIRLQQYLQYRLEVFRVSEVMLDSGFVKPGVQYVQLRYIPQKVREYR